jgi:hypothetical protein
MHGDDRLAESKVERKGSGRRVQGAGKLGFGLLMTL